MTTHTHQRTAAAAVRPRTGSVPIAQRYARRRLASDALVTTFWASSAASVALFLAYGGADQFASLAESITSLGIATGLVGTNLILVMLVLAARIPVIDRTIGHDRAVAVHRSIGKPALYLLLAHGVLLLVGYGISEGINPVAEIWSMLTLPDMPLAFIAMGLLVLVVVSSLVAVRRSFSYEGWHLIHLLSYAAVLTAVPHQLSEGGVLAEGTAQRVYWIALYVLAFGSILTYRFIEPTVASLRHRIRVAGVDTIAPGVVSIRLAGEKLHDLDAAGGQFFIWRFWSRGTWWHSHPFSLSSMPTATSARITVRDLGSGSRQLTGLRPGTPVSIQGPYGLFSDAARTAPRLAIIAAGIGVTPVRALLEDARLAPGEATVLLRASTVDETYHWDEIRDVAARAGARVYTMIGPRATHGPSWMSAADAARGVTLTSVFPHLRESDLYLCGPTGWLDSVESDAVAAGIPSHALHSERFDW